MGSRERAGTAKSDPALLQTGTPAAIRLDRFLWFARIVGSRKYAQDMASAGHLRIDGRAVDRPAAAVRVGNVLAFPTHAGRIRAIRVTALPHRRGPASEARACYTELIENVSHQSPRD